MLGIVVSVLLGVAVTASPTNTQRIVGGELTTIEAYPMMAVLQWTWDGSFWNHECGGSILNTRSILTAAHCSNFVTAPERWRARVGSTFQSTGGTTHTMSRLITHPNYNQRNNDADIAVWRVATLIVYSNVVQPASIPSSSYVLADNEAVWAAGWGRTAVLGPLSEQLQHVQIYTINQAVCSVRYGGSVITDNMLCSGVLDVGGRDQCFGDSGGPLLHRGVVVGVCSWGVGCASPLYPGVNTRVTRFTPWIQANA